MVYLPELPALSRKQKLVWGGFLLFFIIFLTGFYIFLSIKVDQKTAIAIPPTPPSANWKTETSTKHNFSFAYPPFLNLPIQNRSDDNWSFEYNGNPAVDITATNLSVEDAKAKYPSIDFKKASDKIYYADIITDGPKGKNSQRRLFIVPLGKDKYIWVLAYISAFDLPAQEIEQMLNTLLNSITSF